MRVGRPGRTYETQRVDVVGAVLFPAVLLAVTKAGDWGWSSSRTHSDYCSASALRALPARERAAGGGDRAPTWG
jgi:hypothetical protein